MRIHHALRLGPLALALLLGGCSQPQEDSVAPPETSLPNTGATNTTAPVTAPARPTPPPQAGDLPAHPPAARVPDASLPAETASGGEDERLRQCQSNMKQLALGVMMYAQDYDEKFPLAQNWAEAMQPYVRNMRILHCPADPRGPDTVSYGFNTALAGQSLAKVTHPALTTMLFETKKAGKNPASGAKEVVRPPRHAGGNVFAYSDGHVRQESATPGFSLARK